MKFKFGERVKINLPFYEKANGVVIEYIPVDVQAFSVLVQLTHPTGRIIKPMFKEFKEEELSSLEGNR